MTRIWRPLCLLSFFLAIPGNSAWALTFHANLNPIHADAMPGEVVNRDFTLTIPQTEAATTFNVHVQDFWRSEDLKQSFYKAPGTVSLSCAPWIRVNPVQSTVAPGASLDAKISVVVPIDAKPGGYWCVLCVDQLPDPLAPPMKAGVGVHFLTSISLGIYINILPVQRSAKITHVTVDGQSATLTLADTGDCPLFVQGRFEFVRTGETKAFATLLISETTLFPQPVNTALLSVPLPEVSKLPTGRYLVRAIVDIGLDHYIGVQKELDISRGDSQTKQAQAGSN